MPLLQLRVAHLAFGPVPVLDAVDLAIEARERVCLIGRNGTGKSTLLKVVSGTQALEGGTVQRADGLRIGVLDQTVPQGGEATIHAVVAEGLGDHGALLERFHRASIAAGSGDEAALEELGRLQEAIEVAGAWDANRRVEALLDRLGLPADARLADCSGGMRRRAMLARALVTEPDLLILDEPTNHLDIEAVTELEDAVRGFPGAVLFVTHDRAFIGAVATRIVELDRGTLRSYPGDYATYQRRKAEELAAEAEADKQQDRFLAQEEAWIRQGIKARRTRDEGRVRRLEALRKARAERRERKGDVTLAAGDVERSGKIVIEVEDLAFAHGERTIVDGFSTRILRGDRVGLIGRNGSGKTTLLRLLLGQLPPDRGTVRLGTQLQIAYFDQERMQLDVEATLRDNVVEGSDFIEVGGKRKHVIGYLGDFLFSPRQAQAPVKTLSGGERNRLLLAKLFAKPANLLVLDEPTNDLDVETLELLEELLAEWPGTLLLVSHDRTFLDRVVTSTLVLDGEGGVAEYVGGYSDWVRQRPDTGAGAPAGRSAPDGTAPRTVSGAASVGAASVGAASDAAEATGTEGAAPAAPGGGGAVRTGLPPARKKLGYKEQRELEGLPARIEQLEAAQEAAVAKTLAPDFYKGDREAIAAALAAVKDLEAQLEAAYARWEALEAGG